MEDLEETLRGCKVKIIKGKHKDRKGIFLYFMSNGELAINTFDHYNLYNLREPPLNVKFTGKKIKIESYPKLALKN